MFVFVDAPAKVLVAMEVPLLNYRSNAVAFTYLPDPEFHVISPTQGPAYGGTTVTITGRHILPPVPPTVAVFFLFGDQVENEVPVSYSPLFPDRYTCATPPIGDEGVYPLAVSYGDHGVFETPLEFRYRCTVRSVLLTNECKRVRLSIE